MAGEQKSPSRVETKEVGEQCSFESTLKNHFTQVNFDLKTLIGHRNELADVSSVSPSWERLTKG